MNEALIICCALAVCFSIIALICGLVSVAMVAGFTRSTHTVQFKPLLHSGEEVPSKDPLAELLGEEEIGENPLKAPKRRWDLETGQPVKDTESEQKEFMEEVTDSNNF